MFHSPQINQRRRLKGFGVTVWPVVVGRKIECPSMSRIYKSLKSYGFRETWWQFVYQGQLGGLVLPYEDGYSEIHIRFYADRMFAEYEIGRAYLCHFGTPRYNANAFILDLLQSRLTRDDFNYLIAMLDRSRHLDEERELPEWKGPSADAVRLRSGPVKIGWKLCLSVGGSALMALSAIAQSVGLGVLSSVVICGALFFLPSRGRP